MNGTDSVAGVILVDKPIGPTSFAVVQRVRRLLGVKKVGHAGTLDPFASGLLILCVGREATKYIDRFMVGQKTYQAVLQLGQETETLDPESAVTVVQPVPELSTEILAALLHEFLGPQLQAPPAYSAAKHQGKPLYHYARQGIVIEKEAKPIEIYSIELNCYDAEQAQMSITVSCSRGTYIRVLAADIGHKIGCGAHLLALRRTSSSGFTVEEALVGDLLFAHSNDMLTMVHNSMLPVDQALLNTAQ